MCYDRKCHIHFLRPIKKEGLRPPASIIFDFFVERWGCGIPIAPSGCRSPKSPPSLLSGDQKFGSFAVPLEPVGVLTASPIILNPITLCLPKYLKKERLGGEQLCLVFVLVERGGLELSCSFPMQKYVVCWPSQRKC